MSVCLEDVSRGLEEDSDVEAETRTGFCFVWSAERGTASRSFGQSSGNAIVPVLRFSQPATPLRH